MRTITCFKAYDLRGRLGIELDEDVAWRIGRGFVAATGAARVVVGRDCRLSSPALAAALVRGLTEAGAEVVDLGLCGTEEVYFGTAHFAADGGIEVTASHNPVDWNGMKFIGPGAAPVSTETLAAVRRAAEAPGEVAKVAGRVVPGAQARSAYVERVLGFVEIERLPKLTLLVDAGNGAAGPTFDALASELEARGAPFTFVRRLHEPDGSFPEGVPNPLLPGAREATARAVVAAGADMGVAWDGDFDRCFLFDHEGRFIPGEYVVALLAEAFLAKEPGATIVHDPRVVWSIRDTIAGAGGRALQARTGHAFLKAAMRASGAVYGGEMSAHHYFRDFMACDSGMIPWLLVAELIGRRKARLADLVAARTAAFPSSGEINFRVDDAAAAVARVEAAHAPDAVARDDMDGMSLEFEDWRLNLRSSNTEPLLRLNVEARGSAVDLQGRVSEIARLIES